VHVNIPMSFPMQQASVQLKKYEAILIVVNIIYFY
jgi:hypothetical protein